MGFFFKSKDEKIVRSVAELAVDCYQKNKKQDGKDSSAILAFDELYQTTRTVVSILLEKLGSDFTSQAWKDAQEEVRVHFGRRIDAGATIGLVDVCVIAHGSVMGLQETYTKTMNLYIQALYKQDVVRWEIQGTVYEEECRAAL